MANTVFEHEAVHNCPWYQNTLSQRSMTMLNYFVVVSSHLWHVFNTWVKRGAELSTGHHLVVSWVRWQGRLLDRPGKLKQVVRGGWECLAEAPVCEVFNSHLWRNFSCIRRRLETWNQSGTCSGLQLWKWLLRVVGRSEGHWCLSE